MTTSSIDLNNLFGLNAAECFTLYKIINTIDGYEFKNIAIIHIYL